MSAGRSDSDPLISVMARVRRRRAMSGPRSRTSTLHPADVDLAADPRRNQTEWPLRSTSIGLRRSPSSCMP